MWLILLVYFGGVVYYLFIEPARIRKTKRQAEQAVKRELQLVAPPDPDELAELDDMFNDAGTDPYDYDPHPHLRLVK